MKYLRMNFKLIVLSFLFVGFFSCSEKEQLSDKKVFRYNEVSTLSSLDPSFGTYLANVWAVTQLYNAPLEFNDKLEIQPSLAKNWNVSDSGRVYTLNIRDDVYFHDHALFPDGKGRKCTAYDLEYTLKRVCDTTDIYNKGIWVFKDKVLKDAQGMISDTCFKAINDTVINIYLERSVPNFLQILCMPFCYVVPHEITEHYGRDFGRHPVGTGPFKFDSWDEGNTMIFLKNESYWKKDANGVQLPYLDAVEISFISDVNQSFRAFQLGYFDFVTRLNESVLDEVLYPDGSVKEEVEEKFTVFKGPYLATDYLGFQLDNTTEVYEDDANSPLLNADFRKALNYAVDRKRIVTLLRNGLGIVGENGFVPPAMPYFDAEKVDGYAFDPQKAIEHLKKSNYKASEVKGVKLTIAKNYQELAEFLAKTWKEVLGVDVAIDMNDGKVCLDLAQTGRINFFKMGWLADYPDGENYLTLFTSSNFSPEGPNRVHYSNPKYDSLYDASSVITNPTERGVVYEEMDNLLLSESPIIVLYYGQILALTNKNVKGLHLNPMNNLVLETVDLE